MPNRLLTAFEALFRGKPYRHRDPTQADRVAAELYEDLVALARSAKLAERIAAQRRC